MKTDSEGAVMLPSAKIEDLVPVGARVLIRVEEVASITKGGIALPQSVVEAQRPARGVVVRAGPECKEIGVGDYVVFMMYAGSFIESADEAERAAHEESKEVYRIVREPEVFGVWKSGSWGYLRRGERVTDDD